MKRMLKRLFPARRHALLGLATCAALAGCAVGPRYERPSAPSAPAFKETPGWVQAAPADALDRGPWWVLFDDPVLNDLEQRVVVSNQNIAAAVAAYEQARALVREQRASLFPTLSATGGATRSGGGDTPTASRYQAALGASQIFGILNNAEMPRETVELTGGRKVTLTPAVFSHVRSRT